MSHKSDIEIAREANMLPIQQIGAKLDIPEKDLLPFGHDKAKISAEFIKAQRDGKDGKLVLVTAINPTPAGEVPSPVPASRILKKVLFFGMDAI